MNELNSNLYLAITSGALLYEETIALSSYFTSERIELIDEESANNTMVKINSEASRKRIIHEIKRRYHSVGDQFYGNFNHFTVPEQKLIILYSCMKTYSMLFDFIFDVVIEKWLSFDLVINTSDVEKFLDIKSNIHKEIDKWSETTRKKNISVLILMLKQAGMITNSKLTQVEASDSFWHLFVESNENWFLEAGLLSKEQREKIING